MSERLVLVVVLGAAFVLAVYVGVMWLRYLWHATEGVPEQRELPPSDDYHAERWSSTPPISPQVRVRIAHLRLIRGGKLTQAHIDGRDDKVS